MEWIVSVPIVGRMSVFVEAESEEEAKDKALAGEWDGNEIEETNIIERCQGNICHLSGGIDVTPND